MAAGHAPQVFPREYGTDVAEIRTTMTRVFSARALQALAAVHYLDNR